MGWVADTFGQADSMATPFGKALAALGATPVVVAGREPENITAALLVGCARLGGRRRRAAFRCPTFAPRVGPHARQPSRRAAGATLTTERLPGT